MTTSMLIASKYNNSTLWDAAPPLRAIVLSLQLCEFGGSSGVVGGQSGGGGGVKVDPANQTELQHQVSINHKERR